jgi:hypothetical protein
MVTIGSLPNKDPCQSYLIHPEMSTTHLDFAVGRYGPCVHLSFRHDGDTKLHPTSLRILNIFEDLVSHITSITPLSAAQALADLTNPCPSFRPRLQALTRRFSLELLGDLPPHRRANSRFSPGAGEINIFLPRPPFLNRKNRLEMVA